jgi:hypothetical protein
MTMSTEILTNIEAAYLQERISFATNTRRAAVALEQGDTSAHFALHRAAGQAKFGIGFFGRTLTKERKAELTKMAARAAA